MIIPQYKAGYPRVTHPSATKFFKSKLSKNFVRLACVKHAASVHPEPGSNSQIKIASRIVMSNFMSSFRRKLRILSYSFSLRCPAGFLPTFILVIFIVLFLNFRINFG